MFPHQYILFISPPGIGKSELTDRVGELIGSLDDHFVSPTSVTKAALMDSLSEANRRYITTSPLPDGSRNSVYHFNSLFCCINEFGVFLPAWDAEFMHSLTDLWDSKRYEERRRNKNVEPIQMMRPQLNLLGGCTPAYLTGTLPEGAWDMGFLSRTILIYSGEQEKSSLFSESVQDKSLWKDLVTGLREIGSLYGPVSWSEEAKAMIDNFWLTGGDHQPDHPKLLNYTTRRTVHLIKLCIIASVCRSRDFVITDEDFLRAQGWLLEAESTMPEIFKALGRDGDAKVIEEVWYYVFDSYTRNNKKPVPEHRVIAYLQERTPSHKVMQILDLMVKSQLLKPSLSKVKSYSPGTRSRSH